MATNVTEDELSAAYELLRAGRKRDSLKAFESLMVRAPENLKVIHGAGLAFQLNGRHNEALKLFDIRLRNGGDSAIVLHNVSVSHVQLGRYVDAEKSEERAVALDPNNHELQLTLATIKIYLRKFDEGKALLSRYVYACPGDGRGYMMMAELVRTQATAQDIFDSMKTAVYYTEKSYQLAPEKWQGRRLLAICYMNLGRWDRAIMTVLGLWPVREKNN